ncbi:WXG100 family type VII secretion target [Streptomyces sp. NPDC005125]
MANTAADFPQMQQALGLITQTLESCRQVQTNTESHVETLMATWESSAQQTFRGVMQSFSERCMAIRAQLNTIEDQVQETLGMQVSSNEETETAMSELESLMGGLGSGGAGPA